MIFLSKESFKTKNTKVISVRVRSLCKSFVLFAQIPCFAYNSFHSNNSTTFACKTSIIQKNASVRKCIHLHHTTENSIISMFFHTHTINNLGIDYLSIVMTINTWQLKKVSDMTMTIFFLHNSSRNEKKFHFGQKNHKNLEFFQ